MQTQLHQIRSAARSLELSVRPRPQRRRTSGGIAVRTALCIMLCAAVFCCKQYWPEGAQAMRQVIFGAEDSRTQAVFSAFSEAVTGGEPVAETFSELCDEMFTRNPL
jgi:hypothetical protein